MAAELKLTEVGKSYWNESGANQELMKRLTDKFVEFKGCSKNLNGEVIRAINRLYYEYCNNGNCNACEEVTVRYGEWVDCPYCHGTGVCCEGDEEYECTDCGGEGGWYEEDECEYRIDNYYSNFLNLVREYLSTNGYEKEASEIIDNIESIIENKPYCSHNKYFSDENMNAYDRMVDYVVYLVANKENDNTPIPDWYENE